MTTVIAVSNQKGGVGKTTTSVSLGAEFGQGGLRTLLIDLDPQASASSGLRVALPSDGKDLYDVFFGNLSLSSILVPSRVENLTVVPGSKDLVGLEIELGKKPGRELILRTELSLLLQRYDVVLIDCPPSSGLLTLNALGAANSILIPLQAEYYALEGISALMSTFEFVRQTFNPSLQILGVFMTMFDGRTNLSTQVEAEVFAFFGKKMFSAKIPRNIKLSECPSHGLPICLYDAQSSGAKAYQALSSEIRFRIGLETVQNIVNG